MPAPVTCSMRGSRSSRSAISSDIVGPPPHRCTQNSIFALCARWANSASGGCYDIAPTHCRLPALSGCSGVSIGSRQPDPQRLRPPFRAPAATSHNADRVLRFLVPDDICHDTVARRHRALRGFYRYVQARHGALLPTLPDLPNGCSSNFTPYVYSHAELKRLLRTTPEACGNPRGQVEALVLRTLILLLYGAGLRLGEALALNISDLDLEQSLLRVRQSKFYKSRLVPFGEDLTRVLRQYCCRRDRRYPSDPGSPVFRLRNGRRAHHKIIERTFRHLCLMAAGTARGRFAPAAASSRSAPHGCRSPADPLVSKRRRSAASPSSIGNVSRA